MILKNKPRLRNVEKRTKHRRKKTNKRKQSVGKKIFTRNQDIPTNGDCILRMHFWIVVRTYICIPITTQCGLGRCTFFFQTEHRSFRYLSQFTHFFLYFGIVIWRKKMFIFRLTHYLTQFLTASFSSFIGFFCCRTIGRPNLFTAIPKLMV